MDFVCFLFEFFGGKVLLLVEVKKYIHQRNSEQVLVIQSHKLNFIKTLIIWQSCFLKASGPTSFVKIFKWSLNWIRSFYQGWKIQVIIIGILARIRIIIWIWFFIRFWTEKKDSKLHIYTLYNVILRIARNLLETRENTKIKSHPFYHIICD